MLLSIRALPPRSPEDNHRFVKEGGVSTIAAPSRQEEVSNLRSNRLSTRGKPYLLRFPSSVNPSVVHHRLDFRAREGCASNPTAGAPSSGASFLSESRPARRRALLLPLCPQRVKGDRKRVRNERSSGSPIAHIQASTRTFTRRHRSASCAASGAGTPPRCARSCAAIADRRASACSRTSFTTT